MPRISVSTAAHLLAQRIALGRRLLSTNPPLAPTGTITAFLTICAFIRPSTSVR